MPKLRRLQPGQSRLIYDSPTLSLTLHRKPVHEGAAMQLTVHTFDARGRTIEHVVEGTATVASLAETLAHWTSFTEEN